MAPRLRVIGASATTPGLRVPKLIGVTFRADRNYEAALEEARRGFDHLADEVTLVRNRAISLLGMGGIAAAFLGGLSSRDRTSPSGWTWLAAIAFVGLAVLCVLVLRRRRFYATQDPAELVGWIEYDDASDNEVTRDLALWLGEEYDKNRPDVDRLGQLVTLASATFLLELTALFLDLVTR